MWKDACPGKLIRQSSIISTITQKLCREISHTQQMSWFQTFFPFIRLEYETAMFLKLWPLLWYDPTLIHICLRWDGMQCRIQSSVCVYVLQMGWQVRLIKSWQLKTISAGGRVGRPHLCILRNFPNAVSLPTISLEIEPAKQIVPDLSGLTRPLQHSSTHNPSQSTS